MLKKILAGTDGSPSASLAVAYAAAMAHLAGAELLVVHAQPGQAEGSQPLGGPEAPSSADVGKAILDYETEKHGSSVTVRPFLEEGAAADAIVDVAEREGADLIVVGNRGMTGASRFVLGSVPNNVAHHAPCSVFIVQTSSEGNRGGHLRMCQRAVIATDGSETAEQAVRVGGEIAGTMGAEILVLHVGDPREGEEILRRASEILGDGGATMTVEGDPADRIIETAERERCDLIVVGSKGMTGAKRFLLGSVPNKISHHAPCSVLIVKTA